MAQRVLTYATGSWPSSGPVGWAEALASLRMLNLIAAGLHGAVAAAVLACAVWGDAKYYMRVTRNMVILDKDWAYRLSNCTKDCFSVTAARDPAEDSLSGICVGGTPGSFGPCPPWASPVSCEDSLSTVMNLFARPVPVAQFQLVWLVFALQTVTWVTHAYLGAGGEWGMSDADWLRNMSANRQPLRWLEYSASAGLMTVVIASLGRITDVYALLGLFASTALTMVCGHELEGARGLGSKALWWLAGAVAFGSTWYIVLSNYISFISFFRTSDVGTRRFQSLIRSIWPPDPADPTASRGDFFSKIDLLMELAIFVPFSLFLVFATLAATVAMAQQHTRDRAERARRPLRPVSWWRFWTRCTCCCCWTSRRAADSVERASKVCVRISAEEYEDEDVGALTKTQTSAAAEAERPKLPESALLGPVYYALGVERSYIALSFLSKLALAALLTAGAAQVERDACD